MKIKLTSVFVDSPDQAFKFYTEVLGFIKKLYVPEAHLAIVASPEEPDGTGLLLEPNGNPIAKTYQEAVYKAGLPVIVFGVEDIQKEYDRRYHIRIPAAREKKKLTRLNPHFIILYPTNMKSRHNYRTRCSELRTRRAGLAKSLRRPANLP